MANNNMTNSNNHVYKWMVRKGSVLLFINEDKIHLELDKEGHESCLLTPKDTEELIDLLTSLSRDIWERPDLVKQPYLQRLYKVDDNGLVHWDIDQTTLYIGFNETENAVEINYSGDAVVEIPVNYSVEVIQILSHFYKQF